MCFNAVGDHKHLELLGDSDQSLRQDLIVRVVRNPVNESFVDFNEVKKEIL